jgi:hypothetical protein
MFTLKAKHIVVLLVGVLLFSNVSAGPLTVGACYSACNAAWVTCLASYGIVAGTTGPIGWWAWFASAPAVCSGAQGACMAACTATVLLPTP